MNHGHGNLRAVRALTGALLAVSLSMSPVALSEAPVATAGGTPVTVDQRIDEVIVVGQKLTPITVQPRGLAVSLGEMQFGAINAVNVEDLMKYAPNFYVRKRYIGDDNAVVGLRGTNSIQSARTLVMVDGFVVSNFLGNRWDYPPKWNVVGPSEVEQFDIVYGPYSARYSGNSMGGIVSVTTRDPVGTEIYATPQTFTMPYRQYGTDDRYGGYSLEAGGGFRQQHGPISLRASVRRLDSVGQPMSFSLLTSAAGNGGTSVTGASIDPLLATPVFAAASPTHVIQDQFRTRVGYEFGDGWRADALYFYWKSSSDQSEPETYLRDAAGNPVYQGTVRFENATYSARGITMAQGDRTEMLAGVRLNGPLAGWDSSINVSHYWIDSERARVSSDYNAGANDGTGTVTDTRDTGWWTATMLFERTFDRHAVAAGADYNQYTTARDTWNTTNWQEATGRVFAAATYGKTHLAGAFVEDEIAIGDRVRVTPGFRIEEWRAYDGGLGRQLAGVAQYDDYATRTESATSPKLSTQVEIAPGWLAQLALATSTRFPTVGELYQGRIDPVTGQLDPTSFDPKLKPEKSRDANLMLRHQLGRARFTGSVFYQRIDDAIFSFNGADAYGNILTSYKNIDRVRQYGVELIAEATDLLLPGLDLDVNVAWVDATTIENSGDPRAEGVRFPRIPEWRVNGNARYRIRDNLKLSMGWRYASRPNSDLLGQKRGDTYTYISEILAVDGRLSWEMTPQLEFSIGVDNIANDHGWVSHPLPQRTYIADLKWRMRESP